MGEFFRGWRRKTGVVTLMMACVAMSGWVRSELKFDTVHFNRSDDFYRLFTCSGRLGLFHIIGTPKSDYDEGILVGPDYLSVVFSVDGMEADISVRWKLIGFHFQTGELGSQSRYAVYTIPYWSITIPLTLISFWLLIIKPRPTNQKKLTEPAADEGA